MEAEPIADVLVGSLTHKARDIGHALRELLKRRDGKGMQARAWPHITRVIQGEQIVVIRAAASGAEEPERVDEIGVDVTGEQQTGDQQVRPDKARRTSTGEY